VSNDIGDPAAIPGACLVVIVDADHRVRSGMTGLLELADGLTIVAAVGTADEALAAARLDPDAFLLDPRLPEADEGLALIPRLRTVAPRARVLVLWWTPAVADAAVAAGADGIIDKCEDPAPFTEAVLAALAGTRAGSSHVSDDGLEGPRISPRPSSADQPQAHP